MKPIRFVHISDTHIRRHPLESNLSCVFQNVPDPAANLKDIFDRISGMNIDFIIISGDLVHEGEEDDYRCLQQLIEERKFDIPVLLALGNHDRKQAFRKVFLHQDSEAPYYYTRDVKGLRVIVLDSAWTGHGWGFIDKTQRQWLKEKLAEPSERGSIAVMHHPLFWENASLAVRQADELKSILACSEVRGVFCGHIHKNNIFLSPQRIFQSIAEASAFGFDYGSQSLMASERSGFSVCTLEEREQISVCQEQIHAGRQMNTIMSMKELLHLLS